MSNITHQPPSCSLSILVARTDVSFMLQTVPHLVRSCAFPFKERALVVDTAPLGEDYARRPGIGSAERLRDCCQQLVDEGWIDRLHFIDYAVERRAQLNRLYFGRPLRETHDFRGYPVYGSVFALEAAATDLVVHFDSDMLLHQDPKFSWISEGAKLLNKRRDVLFAAPLSGPPAPDGTLHQGSTVHEWDPDGFHRFSFFTSRKFLVDRRRLREVAPISPWWTSQKRRCLAWLKGASALWSFEMMATRRMQSLSLWRADLSDTRAWTLHTPDHGPEFIQRLADVITRVEAGDSPPQQAGHYDLNLSCWRR